MTVLEENRGDDGNSSVAELKVYILGLQMTDVELDERVTALEENGGGGNPQNGKLKVMHVPPRVNLREHISCTPPQSSSKAEPTLTLKPREDITRSPKQGYQWSHK